jgi:hypothetical protein
MKQFRFGRTDSGDMATRLDSSRKIWLPAALAEISEPLPAKKPLAALPLIPHHFDEPSCVRLNAFAVEPGADCTVVLGWTLGYFRCTGASSAYQDENGGDSKAGTAHLAKGKSQVL